METLQSLVCKSLEDHDFVSSECKGRIVEIAIGNVETNACRDYYNALLMDLVRKGLSKERALGSLKSLKDICPEYFL